MSALGVDTRSDIYSLGVLLYELLTGSTPITHKRLKEAAFGELLRLIKEEEPPRPSTRLGESGEALASISAQRHTEPAKLAKLMRGEVDWIVMKALEKDRNRRYETANGFAADVQRYLNDEVVQAYPPSAWYRFRRFARRNTRAMATASLFGVFVLAAVGSAAGIIGWAARDREALREEVVREAKAREMALDGVVDRALDEAAPLVDSAKWPEALAIVQRAEKLLMVAGRKELPRRLKALRQDLALAQELEEIFSRPKEEEFWHGLEMDDAYAKTFGDAGIDLVALSVKEAARRIRARGIWREQARALDIWAIIRKNAGIQKAPDWRRILEIAELTDPDPWRVALRQARRNGRREDLAEMAASADVTRLRPESLYLLGSALSDSGEKEQAVALLNKAHVQYPEDWWISNLLGWHYLFVLDPPQCDDGLRFYAASMAVRPLNPYCLDAIAKGLMGKNSHAEAVVVYSRIIELRPKYATSWLDRALAHSKMARFEESIADCSKAIDLDPKLDIAWNNRGFSRQDLGQYEEAIVDYDGAIALNPNTWQYWANRGDAYSNLGQDDKALADYARGLKLNPACVALHYNRGTACRKLGRCDEAIADYSEAIKLNPELLAAWKGRGLAYDKLGRKELADADASRAAELNSTFATRWRIRGVAHETLGQKDEAIACFKKAIELHPKNPDAHLSLAKALKTRGKRDEAIACLKEAIELYPGNVAESIKRVEHDDLVALVTSELKDAPKSALWHETRARAYARLGRFDESAADFAKLIELSPKNPGDFLFPIYQSLAPLDEVFNLVVKLRPDDADLWVQRGRYYALRSQWDVALKAYSHLDVDVLQLGDPAWEYALLLVLTGDDEGYRRLCTRLHERFGDEFENDWLAKILLAGADSGVDPRKTLRMTERSIALPSSGDWTLHDHGLALYRAGQYEAAIEKVKGLVHGHNAAIIALSSHRLGREEEGRKAYDQASYWIQWSTPKDPERPSSVLPVHWIYAHVLLREAALLQKPEHQGPTRPESPPK